MVCIITYKGMINIYAVVSLSVYLTRSPYIVTLHVTFTLASTFQVSGSENLELGSTREL